MNVVKPFLTAVLILTVVVGSLSAQTSSSSKQTVTFGVYRLAPMILASTQLAAMTLKESNNFAQSLLKVSVGSGLRSERSIDVSISEIGSLLSTSIDPRKTKFSAKKFLPAASAPSDRSVITLTE